MAKPTEDEARKSTGSIDPSYRDYAASEATPNPDDDPATGDAPVDEVSLANRYRLAEETPERGEAPDGMVDDQKSAPPPQGDEDVLEDRELKETDENRIGAGRGLDEAEMGRANPLDDKPWDGDPDEPYGTD